MGRLMDWRKSTHSGGNGGDCIEVATADAVLVRDSKDRDGLVLAFTSATWTTFVAMLRKLGSDLIHPLRSLSPPPRLTFPGRPLPPLSSGPSLFVGPAKPQ
jgi:hypothetical protein